jgi:acetyl esterase/lipase
MRILRRAASLALAILISACSAAGILNSTIPTGDLQITRDVAYAAGPRHSLDIYRPSQAAGRLPLIVFLYGGDWRSGDKSMYTFVAAPLARRGAVVMVPDYRLFPEVQYPAFLQDNAAAVAWAIGHAAEYGANSHDVFIVGHSAGAYDAAMLALDPRWLRAVGVDPQSLAGVVGLAGPYDFLPIVDKPTIPVFASAPDDPGTQPINHVDGHNPPMLLIAGKDDTTVEPRNTTVLAARIAAAGGPVEDKLYPGLGHIGLITAFAPLFSGRAPVLDDVWQFVTSHPAPAG